MQDILETPDKPWEWDYISCNPNITMKDIKENPDKPWDWYYVSMNPNITIQYILENPNKRWSWYGISGNSFTNDKVKFQCHQYQRHLACYRIQQQWHRIRSDPRHPVGQRRLELEYEREFGCNVSAIALGL